MTESSVAEPVVPDPGAGTSTKVVALVVETTRIEATTAVPTVPAAAGSHHQRRESAASE
jgi:hypothetical protein